MKFVCIMGIKNAGKSTLEHKLEQIGFKRSISYTTRKPQVRDGKIEENGVEYNFITRDKFLELVDKGTIIEYEEYGGELYGTPKPFGAQRYVGVVCIGGYRALKKKYGKQILGVYLQCDAEIAVERAEKRDKENLDKTLKQLKYDDIITSIMEKEADVIINGNQDVQSTTADILKVLRDLNI